MADQEDIELDEEAVLNEDDKPEEEDEETIRVKEAVQKFKEDIKTGLSSIQKIYSGQSWAYVKLNLAEKEIDKLYPNLLECKHLRHLDISGNSLVDVSLVTDLQFLTTLNCSKNQIPSLTVFNPEADEPILPYLQFLNVSGNKLQQLENIKLGRLRRLVLNENEIVTAEGFEGHPTLEYLEIKTNKIKDLQGFHNMPNLVELNLEENEITKFRHIRDLPKLKSLILAKNKIKKIRQPLPYLPYLNHLSVSENELSNFTEILNIDFKTLTSLSVQGNPIGDVEDMKQEILIFMDYFTVINDEPVTKEERNNAKQTLQERIEEAERQAKEAQEEQERLQAEEEERLRVEEEERKKVEEEERKIREEEEEKARKEQEEKEQQEKEAAEAAKKEAEAAEGEKKEEGGEPEGEVEQKNEE